MKKLTALLLAILTLTACGTAPDEINDSQESTTETYPESNEEITVNVAAIGCSNDIYEKLGNINSIPGVTINRIEYNQSSESQNPYDTLKMDIVSGKDIDIVALSPEYMKPLIYSGYTTDLYPLFEQSEKIKKDDILPNVISGLEVDGKLPAIYPNFWMFTAAAKTSRVGADKENWTYDDAFEAFYNMGEDEEFLIPCNIDSDMKEYFMKRVSIDAVDLKNSTCDFNGDFSDILSRAHQLPTMENKHQAANGMSDEEISVMNSESQCALINDKALVSSVWFHGINSYLCKQIYADFGCEDVTFVGYPSNTGKGYYTFIRTMFAINENSSEKEAAFSVIEEFLGSEFQNDCGLHGGGIPVVTSAFEGSTEISKWNSGSVNSPVTVPGTEENVTITPEVLKKAMDYIKSAEIEAYYDDRLGRIIWEEYNGVFLGEVSEEDCIDALNSRVSIYLSEKQ